MKANDAMKVLRSLGCTMRQGKGSHVVFTSPCGKCSVSVPVHKGEDLGKGLVKAIQRAMEPCLGKGWLGV